MTEANIEHIACTIVEKEGVEGQRTEGLTLEQSIGSDELIFTVMKTSENMLDKPTWQSVQCGINSHVDFTEKALKMNHSSDPNTRIAILEDRCEIRSIKPIEAGELLFFNYNSTEWEMAEPFKDWESGENVQGFMHASPEEKQKILDTNIAAPHIRELASSC